MMDWTQLKYAESAWNLNDSQKRLLADRVQTAAQKHRQLYLPPIWKPFAATAALCAFAFVMLLAWPKAPMKEQSVTLPGSSEARPDEYVPNEQEPDLPQKEPAVQVVPSEQEDEPAPTPQEQGISFADAAAIAKEKAFRQKFNNPLTEQEREALTVYLGAENYYYLKAQQEGLIGAFKENGTKDYTLEFQVFTTENEAGKDLNKQEAWNFTKVDQNVLSTTELGDYRYVHPRILSKEGAESYLKNLTLESAVPEGRMRLRLALKEPLTKEKSTALIKQLLAAEGVVWVEMNYAVKEDSSNPTAVHRFWETQKELPFDEARAIVVEKITRRFNEKLSDKERMAFYIVFSARAKQMIAHDQSKDNTPFKSLYFFTTKETCELDVEKIFNFESLDLLGTEIKHSSTINDVRKDTNSYYYAIKREIYLPNSCETTQEAYNDYTIMLLENASGIFFAKIEKNGISPTDSEWQQIYDNLLKHFLSVECAIGICNETNFASGKSW